MTINYEEIQEQINRNNELRKSIEGIETYPLVPNTDLILREEMEEFDFANPPINPVELYEKLSSTMVKEGGLGLSANQCGLPYRFFVMTGEEIIGVFNPKIVDSSNETIVLDEGCLSYPNLFIRIKRSRRIKVRYQTPVGEVKTEVFEGITARIFQHELDHLDGIIHTQRANAYHLEQAKRRKKIVDRRLGKLST